MKWHYKIVTLVILLVLAACTSQANEPASEQETAVTTSESAPPEEAMADENMEADEMMAEDDEAMMADEAMADEAMADEDMADEDMEHDDEMMADEAMADEDMEHDDEMMADEDMEHDDEMMADYPAWQTIALTDVTTGQSFTLADFAGKTVYVEPMATWCTNCRRQLGYVEEARDQLNSDDVVFVGISVETNIDDATLANYTEETGYNWTFAVATPEMLQALADQFGRTISNPPATPHFIIYPDGTTTDLVTGFETADELIAQLQ
jgi:thiol-disulfide isomerase/thioredoxin